MNELDVVSDHSASNLQCVPQTVLAVRSLKMLYLDRNEIDRLPEDFFQKLPNLYWLDLRNNKLEVIPTGIAHHKCLENLLVQKNNIRTLPNELGLVPNLKVLQLDENPLQYPPAPVIEGGVDDILTFLKDAYKKQILYRQSRDEESIKDGPNSEGRSIQSSQSSSNFSTTLQKTNRTESGTLQLEVLPTLLQNNFSRQVEERRKQYVENQCSRRKVHKVVKSPSRMSVHSHYKYSHVRDVLPSDDKLNSDQIRAIWIDKLRELVLDQERIIQQERTMKALDSWRKQKNEETVKNVVTYETSAPFDTNPAYNAYMSRTDLTKQIERVLRSHRPNVQTNDIEVFVNDIVDQLKAVRETMNECDSPAVKLKSAETELKLITDLNKRLNEYRSKSFL